ncbi:hypothetical protein [Terriglobus sp. TAA 43]|uniref:hypothetical protein n=1 Tax=Terriglobus sp. TAA 43 TaxID=278961 RepID=UPI000646FB62|nr:hypothetical protein [Terriglobus sp. TAA 43]
MRSLFAALAVLSLSVPAVAQDAAVHTVEISAGFREAVLKNFQGYESRLSTHCPTVTPDWNAASHKLYGKPVTGDDGNLSNATWVESVPGTACGEHRRYRVLVTIRGGHAAVAPLLPGESIATPQLESDAQMPLIKATAEFVPKGQTCPVDVLDTKLDGPVPAVARAAWNEIWTVRTCNRTLNVPIRFVPDMVGEGTSIRIESKSVTVAQ